MGLGAQGKKSSPFRKSAAVSEADVPLYREGKIAKIKTPIYLNGFREIHIDPSDPVDQGIAEYFASKADNKNVIVRQNQINHRQCNLRLDSILNAERETKGEDTIRAAHPSLIDLGLSKYMPAQSVGAIPFGRGGGNYVSIDDFRESMGGVFEEALSGDDGLKKLLKESPDDFMLFSEIAGRHGRDWTRDLLDVLASSGKGRKEFMKIFCDYFITKMKKITPTTESLLKMPSKYLDLDFMGDAGITRLRHDDEDNAWKYQGVLYALEKKGNIFLYVADPVSSWGLSTTHSLKSPEEIKSDLEDQLRIDKTEEVLKRNFEKGPSSTYVIEKPLEGKTRLDVIALRGHVEPGTAPESPFVHIPIMNTTQIDEKEMVGIRMGLPYAPNAKDGKDTRTSLLFIGNQEIR